MTKTALIAGLLALTAAGAASAQNATLRPGSPVSGALAASDPKLGDNSHYDCYRLQTARGEQVQVTMSSSAFDTYLVTGAGNDCENGTADQSNDDYDGGGTDSRVTFTSNGGLYWVRANSLSANVTGDYRLEAVVGRAPAPKASAPAVALRQGASLSGALDASDRALPDGSHFDCYTIEPARGSPVRIMLASDAFDAFLATGTGDCASAQPVYSDDDGGGGTNSLVTFTAEDARYWVRANSLSAGETGPYVITWDAGGAQPLARPKTAPGAASAAAAPPAQTAASGRPSAPQARYEWDAVCAGVDLAGMLVGGEMSEDQLMAWIPDAQRLQAAVQTSGAALGKTEDRIDEEVANIASGLMEQDPAQVMTMRRECVSNLPR